MSLLREYSTNPNIRAYRTIGPDEALRRFEQWKYYDDRRRRYNEPIPGHIDPYYNYHNYFPQFGGAWPAEWGAKAGGTGKYTYEVVKRYAGRPRRGSVRSRPKRRRGKKRVSKKRIKKTKRRTRRIGSISSALYNDFIEKRKAGAVGALVHRGVSPLEAINEVSGEEVGEKRPRMEEIGASQLD